MPRRPQPVDMVARAEGKLRKAQAALEAERTALSEARETWRLASAQAKPASRAASNTRVRQAKALVDKKKRRLTVLRAQVTDCRVRLADARVLAKIQASEAAVRQKLTERATALANKAEADRKRAVKAFEQRFVKKRAVEDRTKLREIEKALESKHRQAVKQLSAKLSSPDSLG